MNRDGAAVLVGLAAAIIVAASNKKALEQLHPPDNMEDRNGSDVVGYLTGSTPVVRLLDNRVTPIWGHFRLQ